MLYVIMYAAIVALSVGDAPGKDDARLLIDTIETLQQPVEDFRCEFEGTIRYQGEEAKKLKLGDDGLYDSFSGVFIWKRGGDTHSDSLHRRAPDGMIARESLVVRMRENQAEQYHRLNDAPLGYSVIKSPKEANSWDPGCLGWIFLLDKMKRDIADDGFEATVEDDQIEGRPLKVLNIALKGAPDPSFFRYWIDLRRNGHVVRQESYAPGKVVVSRLDVKLASFKVGDAEVWMPVHGEYSSHAGVVDKRPVVTKEPTFLESIYVVDGTMEFNKRPGRDVFTIKYKPGTPVSDHLRKLEYEFGQQKVGLKPTKAEAEKMLNEQLARAEAQKAELVVASPSEGFDWTRWLAWGMGVAVVVSSAVLWNQWRRH